MSLTTEIIQALSGAPTQNNRLLMLHTPLGRDVLLAERAHVCEGIGPLSVEDAGSVSTTGERIVVQALSIDTHLELKRLIGQPVLVELLTQASRVDLRPWHGHVTRAELMGSDGGLARYRLTIEPWLAFLGHRQDAWVFQNQTVQQIVEEVFADYASQGTLAPAWRWELADPSVYPQRSLCIQYNETDLHFVQRLLREEGLFHWFEHEGDAGSATFGRHTLVIADHNGAFKPDSQARVRYTQSGAALPEDSITGWRRSAHVRTASLALASPDHRARSLRPIGQTGALPGGQQAISGLTLADIPGAYAYEDTTQGERLALRQMQAIDALREQASAESNVRTTAPGRTFTLLDHPVHDGSDAERDRFVVLRAEHHARNNLSADHKAHLESLLGSIARDKAEASAEAQAGEASQANATDEPLYRCALTAQRAAVPVRVAGFNDRGQPDPRLHPRASVHGVQTALVVGVGQAPIHTDRDHRIKVQFHWQRGDNASHRLAHPAGSNAPASDASGTWVRVAQTVAGANWGMNFIPRLGQEVLIAFVEGDIDRPVVIGSAYNGQGQAEGQGNQIAGGAAQATGNAAAWFPGSRAEGAAEGLQGHAHAAVHAGFKSQELGSSRSGSGGHNQLVFDDSAGHGRIELGSTSAKTRLQLGHLLQQTDNQRLQARGHGLDLTTAAWGAVRAGAGLLLSAHGQAGSTGTGQQLASREPHASFEQAKTLLHSLAESSQQHRARLDGEPDVVGATDKDTARQLSAERAHHASLQSLAATAGSGGNDPSQGGTSIGGGTGKSVTQWARPDLVVAAPGGVASFTPSASVYSAGNTLSLVATQDVQLMSQADHALAAKDGLVFYTYGKAANPQKPNTETGISLHAASGSVSLQSQSGATKLTADKAIEVSSTTGTVRITAPKSILMTAAGAAIDIQAGGITLKGPGKVEFRAGMKKLTGPGSAQRQLELNKPGDLKLCELRATTAAAMNEALVVA